MKNRVTTSKNLVRWNTTRQNVMRRVRTLSELFCLLLLLMLTFTGCQLAQEDGAEDMAANMVANMVGTSDRLAGVLITTDYLDLFDFEAKK